MIEITDEMVEAYMDAKSSDWRAGRASFVARIRAIVREDLEIAASLIAPAAGAAEREECAKIAERRGKKGVVDLAEAIGGTAYGKGTRDTAEYIARAIRARGDKP